VGGVRQKQAASETHAHDSAKISGKTWFVQHKKGLKALKKTGPPSQAMGIMKPMAGAQHINPL